MTHCYHPLPILSIVIIDKQLMGGSSELENFSYQALNRKILSLILTLPHND